jgi:hypothetical protein
VLSEAAALPPDGRGAAARRERPRRIGDLEVLLLEAWDPEDEGLVAGITTAPDDFGLATCGSGWDLADRYERLAETLGFEAVAVGRQVHGTAVATVPGMVARGLWIVGETDGLVADAPGILLAVTAADCVPVFLADRGSGALGLLHAGWRGAAAGVLARGLEAMARLRGTDVGDCVVHLGPAICGDCYEVGPEVLARFGRRASAPARLDLRAWLAAEATRLGLARDRVSVSTWCTSCDRGRLHSHRASGGRDGRMAAFLGRRAG